MARRLAAIWIWLVLAGPAYAGDIAVTLRNHKGAPVADAVVTFHPAVTAETSAAPTPINVTQKDSTFIPYMTVVPRGSSVRFLNDDSILHHVFSFSAAKRFSLKLFDSGEPQAVTFDTPGVVVVGCNIHDDMIAYLKVVDTPYSGKTNANGMVTLEGLPGGDGELQIWHPLMKERGNTLKADIDPSTVTQPLSFERKFRRGASPAGDY